jgi:hypothetical protein
VTKFRLSKRAGLPALFLSGAILGGVITGVAFAAQPHMQNALGDLQAARTELNLATADKGGHRAHALNYVSAAITEVQRGIDYSATH